MMLDSLTTTAARQVLASGVFPLMLVVGLLIAPVSCTCGASVPHGHSLFQLPHHHHAAGDKDHEHHSGEEHAGHSNHTDGFAHLPHPLAVDESECNDPQIEMLLAGNFAFSNALEQQDSAILQAPPASSFGQPMAIAQPSLMTIAETSVCESIALPATRVLEGMATSPETPPPRA